MTPEEQRQKIEWCLEMLVNKKCNNPYMKYRDARLIMRRYAFGKDPIVVDKDELITLLIKALRRISLIHYYPKTAQNEKRRMKEEEDEENGEE